MAYSIEERLRTIIDGTNLIFDKMDPLNSKVEVPTVTSSVKSGDVKMLISLMMKSPNLNESDIQDASSNSSDLDLALRQGHIACAAYLLFRGTNPTDTSLQVLKNKKSALFKAIKNHFPKNKIRSALQQSLDGATPLGRVFFSKRGLRECTLKRGTLKKIYNYCIKHNIIDVAILSAADTNNLKAVKALITKAKQAGLFDKDKDLLNHAYRSATENYTLHLAAQHDNAAMASLLVEYGANPDELNKIGKTPLSMAIYNGKIAAFNAMLTSPHYKPTSKINYAILDAVDKNNLKAVKALIAKAKQAGLFDRDKNLLNRVRRSATEDYTLHRAAQHKNAAMVLLLVEHGANPDQKNKAGETTKEFVFTCLMKNQQDQVANITVGSPHFFSSARQVGEESMGLPIANQAAPNVQAVVMDNTHYQL